MAVSSLMASQPGWAWSGPRRRGALTGLSIAALTMSGCAVGPDYVVPKLDMTGFHNAAAITGRAAPLAQPPIDAWWTGFNDPMLVTIVQRALDQNLDLAAALARVQQARAVADAAGAQLLPTVDLDVQGSAERQSLKGPLGTIGKNLPGYSRDQRLYDAGAAASWEIDLFGGLRRDSAAATDEFAAAEAERAGVRVSVAADAADAYMQVRGYQARLAVALDQIEVNTKLLNIVTLRHGSGVSTDRELAQAEALLKQAQATVPLLRIGLEAQLNRLDVLMGVQPGTYAGELSVTAEIPAIPAVGAKDQPLDVLRRRPDIIAAERRLAASNERIGAAISDYYPKISLSGALGFESLNLNHLVTSAAFQPAATGAIRWRLFDFGKVDAEVAQAHGANAEALALYREAALKAVEDVENAFMALVQTEMRTQQLQDEVASLTRARDLSQQSYQAGVIPLTDVLDADRQLLAARDDLANNRADAARAAVRSFRALGGGWRL